MYKKNYVVLIRNRFKLGYKKNPNNVDILKVKCISV